MTGHLRLAGPTTPAGLPRAKVAGEGLRSPTGLDQTEVTVMATTTVTPSPRRVTEPAAAAEVRAARTTLRRTRDDAEDVPEGPRWKRSAACREMPTALFFPAGNFYLARLDEERAKALCSSCPVRARCLTYAIEHQEPYGVWGGLNPDERRALTSAPAITGPESRR
jgi:WhiB family redox-sensing transcriptional regulator